MIKAIEVILEFAVGALIFSSVIAWLIAIYETQRDRKLGLPSNETLRANFMGKTASILGTSAALIFILKTHRVF